MNAGPDAPDLRYKEAGPARGALLSIRHCELSFGGRRILNVERFDIAAGECCLMSGRNGAGKTTLLRVLSGLMRPDRGELRTPYEGDGAWKSWRQQRDSLRAMSVYLHQRAYMFDRSVESNIGFGLRRAGVGRPALRSKVRAALEWSGLAALARHNARTLSGGERQRLALARARVLAPRLLLLDEPTANMDAEAHEQTLGLVHELVIEGVAVVLSTHEKDVIERLGGRRMQIDNGVLSSASPGHVAAAP